MGKAFKSLKPYVSKSVGAFSFNFYYKKGKPERCFLRITGEGDLFSLKIAGNTDTYGYLLTAALQDRDDQLSGYAVLVSVPILALTQNRQLVEDVGKAVGSYMGRRMGDGANEAAKVTEAQEQGVQAVMEDVAEFADAKSDQERDEIRERWKEEIRRVNNDSRYEEDGVQGD